MKKHSIFKLTASELIAFVVTIALLVVIVIFVNSSKRTVDVSNSTIAAADSIEAELQKQDSVPEAIQQGAHHSRKHPHKPRKSKSTASQKQPQQRSFLDESVSE